MPASFYPSFFGFPNKSTIQIWVDGNATISTYVITYKVTSFAMIIVSRFLNSLCSLFVTGYRSGNGGIHVYT